MGFATGNATALAHSESMETGDTVGAGFEYFIAPSWSLKAEYHYIDLGDGSSPGVIANYGPVGGVTWGVAGQPHKLRGHQHGSTWRQPVPSAQSQGGWPFPASGRPHSSIMRPAH